jgi:hypothetical protein
MAGKMQAKKRQNRRAKIAVQARHASSTGKIDAHVGK